MKDPAASHARLLLNDGMKAAVMAGRGMHGWSGWLMGTTHLFFPMPENQDVSDGLFFLGAGLKAAKLYVGKMGVVIEFSLVMLICIPTQWEDPKLLSLRKREICNQDTDGVGVYGAPNLKKHKLAGFLGSLLLNLPIQKTMVLRCSWYGFEYPQIS